MFRREIVPWALLGLVARTGGGRHRRGAREAALRRTRLAARAESRREPRERRAGDVERHQLHLGEHRARARARAADGGAAGRVRIAGRPREPRAARRERAGAHRCSPSWRRAPCGPACSPCGPPCGPPTIRATCSARITGRIVVVSSLAVAASAALVGWSLEEGSVDPRWVYGGGAVAGLVAAWLYREMRVTPSVPALAGRGGERPARQGLQPAACCARFSPRIRHFREYMFWMGLFGGGNLMLDRATRSDIHASSCTSRAASRSRCSP